LQSQGERADTCHGSARASPVAAVKEWREIAAGIDERVRQLAAQGVSDSALVDQMVGYMQPLQRLWNGTTDDELDELLTAYPGFVRYATLMEELSERLRSGAGVPDHIQKLDQYSDSIKAAIESALGAGTEFKQALQVLIDAAGTKGAARASAPRGKRDFDALEKRWTGGRDRLLAAVQAARLPESARALVVKGLDQLGDRIARLQAIAATPDSLAQYHKVTPLQPRMVVNSRFMSAFLAATAPSFGLGVVEERKQQTGFLAVRPDPPIPIEALSAGFRFGHTLVGRRDVEAIDFVFDFYGQATYHALLNPASPIVRRVLNLMVAAKDYVFFSLDTTQGGSMVCFRSEFHIAGIADVLPAIMNARTTEEQYRWAVAEFSRRPEPPGLVLNWVCRDELDYLELSKDRLELKPPT
jgi:hypothetical protein